MSRSLALATLAVCLCVMIVGVAAQPAKTFWLGTSGDDMSSLGLEPISYVQPGTDSGAIILSTDGVEPTSMQLEVVCDTARVTESAGFATAPQAGQTGPGGVASSDLIASFQPGYAFRTCIVAKSTKTSEIGDLFFMATGTACPQDSLPVDGSAQSRTGEYADLFAAISTTYGAGDGSNTFNLPDLVSPSALGEIPIGAGETGGIMGFKAGVDFRSVPVPKHSHSVNDPLLPELTVTDAFPSADVTLDVTQPSIALAFRIVTTGADVGTIKITARSAGPYDPDTVPADGEEIESAELAAVLGGTWGPAEGGADFVVLPDFDGRAAVCVDEFESLITGATSVGLPIGASSVALTEAHVPDHSHWVHGNSVGSVADLIPDETSTTISSVQPSLVVRFIINYAGAVMDESVGRPVGTPFVGEVRVWAGSAIPDGWLLLDGSTVDDNDFDGEGDGELNDPSPYRKLVQVWNAVANPGTNGNTGSMTLPLALGCTIYSVGAKWDSMERHYISSPQLTLTLNHITSHVHTATGLVSSGLVGLSATTPNFEFSFTLTMPSGATAFSDKCLYRFTQQRDKYYLPNDPYFGKFKELQDGQLIPEPDPETGLFTPIDTANGWPFEAAASSEFTFAIGADCVVDDLLTLPAGYATGGTCADKTAVNDKISLNPGETCTYFFDAVGYKLTSTTTHTLTDGVTGATGSVDLTCTNNAPTFVLTNPTFGLASSCLTSDLVPTLAAIPNADWGTCDDEDSVLKDGSCSFVCQAGYTAVGTGEQTCGEANAFTSGSLVCEPDCEVPEVAHSAVSCTLGVADSEPAKFQLGGVCTYTPSPRFYQSSEANSHIVTCKANGVASSAVATALPTFLSSDCSTPATAEGVVSVCAVQSGGLYLHDAECTVGCRSGFSGSTVTRTCNNGEWEGDVEVCNEDCAAGVAIGNNGAIDDAHVGGNCAWPSALKHGDICYTKPSPNHHFVSLADGGATAEQQFVCNNGEIVEYPTYVSSKCAPFSIAGADETVTIGTCATANPMNEGPCQLGCGGSSVLVAESGGEIICTDAVWHTATVTRAQVLANPGAYATAFFPNCAMPCEDQTDDSAVTYEVDCSPASVTEPAHDATCTYTANEDYFIQSGTGTPTGTADQATSQCKFGEMVNPPVFLPRTCVAYSPPAFATKVLGQCGAGSAEGDSCAISCAAGYTEMTAGERTCTLDGTMKWIGTDPVCKKNCNSATLAAVEHASIDCGAGASSPTLQPDPTWASGDSGFCSYVPDANYHHVDNSGSLDVICKDDGTFTVQNPPVFASSLCAPRTLEGSATWQCLTQSCIDDSRTTTCEASNNVGIDRGSCQMGCTPGDAPRTPVGDTGAWTCVKGEWIGSFPTCGAPCNLLSETNAPIAAVPDGAAKQGNTCADVIADGSECKFDPLPNKYLFSGVASVRCNDGNLVAPAAGDLPVYKDSFCTKATLETELLEVDPALSLGNCAQDQDRTLSGQPCSVECNPLTHYQTSVTGGSLLCTNSKWLTDGNPPRFPTCAPSRCDPLSLQPNVDYGTCNYAGLLGNGGTCEFECAYGYEGVPTDNSCVNAELIGGQPICTIAAVPAFLVSAPAFVAAGESAPIVFTVPSSGTVAAAFDFSVTCTQGGMIQCGATGCMSNTCTQTVKAGVTSVSFVFTAPNSFSSAPSVCTFAHTADAAYLDPLPIAIHFGSPAGLTVTLASTTTVDVELVGTIKPEWAPAEELTVLSTCRFGKIAPIYMAANSAAPTSFTYVPSGDAREDRCSFAVRSQTVGTGARDVTAGRYIVPADVHITIGAPVRSFTFVGPGGSITAQAGDAVALFMKPSVAPSEGALTLTITCSGGHVGSATWPIGSTKLMNIPYVASPQCGTESCEWTVSTSGQSSEAILEAATYKVPVEAKWKTIQVAGQTMAYRQWRNQVRINNGRKP